jgi:hypothetical protein
MRGQLTVVQYQRVIDACSAHYYRGSGDFQNLLSVRNALSKWEEKGDWRDRDIILSGC